MVDVCLQGQWAEIATGISHQSVAFQSTWLNFEFVKGSTASSIVTNIYIIMWFLAIVAMLQAKALTYTPCAKF